MAIPMAKPSWVCDSNKIHIDLPFVVSRIIPPCIGWSHAINKERNKKISLVGRKSQLNWNTFRAPLDQEGLDIKDPPLINLALGANILASLFLENGNGGNCLSSRNISEVEDYTA
jgi:hypothetical protein